MPDADITAQLSHKRERLRIVRIVVVCLLVGCILSLSLEGFPPWHLLFLYGCLYGGLSWILLRGASVALRSASEERRDERAHRGLCPACAYDLRGAEHDVCPECGKAVG